MEINDGNTHMLRLAKIHVLCEVDKKSFSGNCKGTECVARQKTLYELPHGKTNTLLRRKQRRRSALQ